MAPSTADSTIRLMDDDDIPEKAFPLPQRRRSRLSYAALWAIVLAQAVIILVQHERSRTACRDPFYLYSPAEDAVKYEFKSFVFNKGDVFQREPAEDVDRAWKALYSNGTSRVPRSVAERLPNKTAEIPRDPDGYYMVGVEVFHELHCLDMIRQAIYPAFYPDMTIQDPRNHAHIRHCLNSIRQSLMCDADVNTIVWQWDEEEQATTFRGDVVHKCKNWDMLHQWASDNVRVSEFDGSVRIDNDIQVPIFHADGSSYMP